MGLVMDEREEIERRPIVRLERKSRTRSSAFIKATDRINPHTADNFCPYQSAYTERRTDPDRIGFDRVAIDTDNS